MLKAGLLGYPIDHSLSPVIHRRAYQELGLDWSYELFSCEKLSDFVATINQAEQEPQSWVGFNVTTPYKVDAFAIADEHSQYDLAVGNANVLTFTARTGLTNPFIRADNTDGRGLIKALEHQSGQAEAVKGASVVLCGGGSVALSILLSLVEEQAADVTIVCRDVKRTQERAHRLCQMYSERCMRSVGGTYATSFVDRTPNVSQDTAPLRKTTPVLPMLEVVGYGSVSEELATADILIDATSVGMVLEDDPVVPIAALHKDLVVLDVVYGHGETALLREARGVGAQAYDGLEMLIEQAALTIEIWAAERGIAIEAPREAMREAALQAMC